MGGLGLLVYRLISQSPAATSELPLGAELQPGESLTSSNGHWVVLMQGGDGNLVEYRGGAVGKLGGEVWNSKTSGHPGAYAKMILCGGTLVIYPRGEGPPAGPQVKDPAIWSTFKKENRDRMLSSRTMAPLLFVHPDQDRVTSQVPDALSGVPFQVPCAISFLDASHITRWVRQVARPASFLTSPRPSRETRSGAEAEGNRRNPNHSSALRASASSCGLLRLAMIVRNEAKTVGRAIDSVRPFVDSWIICDTGSTDGTPEKIYASLADIPGRLIERPWVNFGHNRSELMSLARGSPSTYLLLLDADMTVQVERRTVFDRLTVDAYLVPVLSEVTYWMHYLVKSLVPWRYEGVTHDYITTDRPYRTARLSGVSFQHHADGGSRADEIRAGLSLVVR